MKNKKFHTATYKTNYIIIKGEVKPIYKLVYQKLTLNKENYKVRDSLFGHIEFKSIETDHDTKSQIQHFGKGYFRTKIKEL